MLSLDGVAVNFSRDSLSEGGWSSSMYLNLKSHSGYSKSVFFIGLAIQSSIPTTGI